MRKSKRFISLVTSLNIIILITGSVINNLSAAAPSSEIQTLTVAFLYNFMKLSEWPAGVADIELTLCIIQASDYTIDLDSLADKEIQGHSLKIKHLAQGDSAQDCQLLFITEEEKPIRVREWLKNIANKPVLTVSGTDEFLDNGGMIGLVNDGNHLQFEVNLKRVEQVGIKLSSQMLQIARAVRVKQ